MSSCSCCCFVCVSTSNVGVVENCGKFSFLAEPGCTPFVPCLHSLRGTVSMRLRFASVVVDTKTKDNALVSIQACIHYRIIPERVQDAFYRLSNPDVQIGSFASNVIRGEVPKYTLDEVFVSTRQIKDAVEEELRERLSQYGFALEATLVTQIDPSRELQIAISQTQLNAYRRIAAEHKAEMEKILKIKDSEADFEEKRLGGVGLAEERRAVMEGLQSSIESFVENVQGVKANDVMNILLLNQYFDALKDIGCSGKTKVVILPGGEANHSALMNLVAAQGPAMR